MCFGLAWGFQQTKVGEQQAWKTLDWRTGFRVHFQKPPDPRIAVVIYGDETNDAGPALQWPPDRSVHGELILNIAVGRPKVITFDVILDAIREGEGDARMAASVQRAARVGVKVVTAAVTSADAGEPAPGQEGPTRPLPHVEGDIGRLLGEPDAIRPFPQLRAVSLYGFADAPHGPDGVQREIPLAVRVGNEAYPSLALQTLLAYFDLPVEKVRMRLGDAVYLETPDRVRRVPIDDRGRMLLNYRYDRDDFWDDFPTYSVIGVLIKTNDYFVKKRPFAPKPPNFAGRIVLIGQAVTGKADAGATPRSGYSPLVLVHANLINNVLAEDFAWRVPDWLIWSIALVAGYAGLALMADRSMLLLCGGAVLGIVGYLWLCVWLWVWQSWWLPITGPLIGFGGLQFVVIGRRILVEQRAKREIKGMFGTYLSPVVVEQMVKSGHLPNLGGHEKEITAYFSDIQSFSTFSELMTPARLVELMNEYLTACTDIIQEEGGTLDKYIGDAVVAMFGAPLTLPDHACRAVTVSIRVQQRIEELRRKWRGEGDAWPRVVHHLRARQGLNTGAAIIGNMGSRSRFSYTMMGDNVNLAARMESGAKALGVYTMIAESTRVACERHSGDRIVFRFLDRIVVKGRSQPVPVHEVVGFRTELAPQTLDCLGLHAQAMERYLAQDWDGALRLFERSATLEPLQPSDALALSTNPSLVMIERCRQMKAQPPGPDWDGVFQMVEK